jgi:hypothetical protein
MRCNKHLRATPLIAVRTISPRSASTAVDYSRQCELKTSALKGSTGGLESQNQGVYGRECIHSVKSDASQRARVFGGNQFLVVRIGVGDTTAAGCYAIEPAFVQRLEKDKKGARLRRLSRLDQLLAAAELAGGNVVLHVRDHHRDERHRVGSNRRGQAGAPLHLVLNQ